jgi:hypothetical protein
MASETPKSATPAAKPAAPSRPPVAAPHALATPAVPHVAVAAAHVAVTPAHAPASAVPAPAPVKAAASKPATPIPKSGTAASGGAGARPAASPAPATASANPTFKLPAAVYSPQMLESVIYDIQYYLDWIRQNQIRKQVGAKPKEEPNHSDETVLVIEAWLSGQPATISSIEALHGHLKNLKLPEVHIMLAALPNRTQRVALVEWFRNNTNQQLLLSFVADRNLGGGIVVRTPNRVFDFTWKQELVGARDKLAGILRRV